ncbi:MAG: leucine-rich repeat domain-containing protein [Crocinitomicaceae bacterium]|nr:leucine-rich repeat domain-containing protein [Crocinitomicaceae bacterium]
MKAIFVLFFLLISNIFCWSQETPHVTIYSWEEVMDADPDTILGLSLAKMKLTELPEELARFESLQILNLEKNKLIVLPDFITEFKNLKELNLGKNRFDNFPLPLCRMPSIERLILNRNHFDRFPLCIEGMKALKYLDVYDTPVVKLPSSLENLDHLEEIDFSGIRFSQKFQDSWIARLPEVNLIFDEPCACMDN